MLQCIKINIDKIWQCVVDGVV